MEKDLKKWKWQELNEKQFDLNVRFLELQRTIQDCENRIKAMEPERQAVGTEIVRRVEIIKKNREIAAEKAKQAEIKAAKRKEIRNAKK